MSDEEYVYTTKELVNSWRKRVENVSGLTCSYLDQLSRNATLEEMQEAMKLDRQYFYAYINDIECAL